MLIPRTLRPNVVWLGELVSNIVEASKIMERADIFVVIGTSLKVRPAADLLMYCRFSTPFYVINPNPVKLRIPYDVTYIEQTATQGLETLVRMLLQQEA